jgi:hypothetical protein
MTTKRTWSATVDPSSKEVTCKVYHDGAKIYESRSMLTEAKTAELIRAIMAEPQGDIELVEEVES